MFKALIIVVALILTFGCSTIDENQIESEDFRSPQYWKNHIKNDLLSYWERGKGLNDFSTFRCNDGKVLDLGNKCSEWKNPPDWLKGRIDETHLRMISRQVYMLGVAFHTTGEMKYLNAANHGLSIMREKFNWGKPEVMYSYYKSGYPSKDFVNRTSQDLSYSIVGPAFLYYLTGNQELLKEISLTKNFIFKNYWNNNSFSWVALKSKNKSELARDELVSVLDQINAYMMLISRSLPSDLSEKWKSELAVLADYMIKHFWDSNSKRFWGTHRLKDSYKNTGRHNDFGHTMKAYWMIFHIGQQTGRKDLVKFVQKSAPSILKMAFDKTSKTWGNRLNADGRLVLNKDCWIFTELNQVTMALSFLDSSMHEYLKYTLPFFPINFVDPKYGEIWHAIDPEGVPILAYKSHIWKNGFHATEHGLVAMIYTAKNAGKDLELFYYPHQSSTNHWRQNINPHYFSAKYRNPKMLGKILKVTFGGLSL